MLSLLRDAGVQGLADGHPQRLLRLARASEPESPASQVRLAKSSTESLSDRELQVLRLLDSELTGPQIARQLFVSQNTVRTHTKHIFTKLDVTSRRAAVLRARDRGLL
jgi:LuxR family maltose regulon positive regulatory protein